MLMFAGAMLIILAIALMRYLKMMRNGFTGEDIFHRNGANLKCGSICHLTDDGWIIK